METNSINQWLIPQKFLLALGISGLLLLGAGYYVYLSRHASSPQFRESTEIALKWNRCFLELDRASEGQRPPVSARTFAYIGLAAWESSLPAFSGNTSLSKQYEGFTLPTWEGKNDEFILPAALNAAYRVMAHRFFSHAPMPAHRKYTQLNEAFFKKISSQYPESAVQASKDFGEAVAESIYNWASSDSIGHQAYLYNYDRHYKIAVGPGLWQPDPQDPMPPLLPHWGAARTFVLPVKDMVSVAPPAFSEESGSAYFAQAMEVFTMSQPLSDENRWVAEFWSDDFPGVTFSAGSRWISIATQALEKADANCLVVLRTYLKVGLALNDAAVNAWDKKYIYNKERPVTFIRRNISKQWQPLHGAPSFPTYPSGHSIFGGAAAAVLAAELGEYFSMTDRSHEGRKEFNGMPRTFHSFEEMARENAFSRIPMGVHFRMDCEEGLRMGNLIGEKTNALQLLKEAGAISSNL